MCSLRNKQDKIAISNHTGYLWKSGMYSIYNLGMEWDNCVKISISSHLIHSSESGPFVRLMYFIYSVKFLARLCGGKETSSGLMKLFTYQHPLLTNVCEISDFCQSDYPNYVTWQVNNPVPDPNICLMILVNILSQFYSELEDRTNCTWRWIIKT